MGRTKLSLSLVVGFGLLLSARCFAQLPQPGVVNDPRLYGGQAATGVGGRIPDAQGQMIDHTFQGNQAGAGLYGSFANPGYGSQGGAAVGVGGGIPDVQGNLVDHTYSGSQASTGQTIGSELYGLGAASSSFGSTGTGIFGGGRSQSNFSSQGFYQFNNRFASSSARNDSGSSSLVPFSKRTTSPYLNLANTRGAAGIRYYGLVKPQFQADSQFKAIGDRATQSADAVKTDAVVRGLEAQMRAVIQNERAIQAEIRASDFSSNPGADRFRALGSQPGSGQAQDDPYQQRLAELANLIQNNGLAVKGELPVNRTPIRLPGTVGGALPNFGNTSHYYGTQTQNLPNFRLNR